MRDLTDAFDARANCSKIQTVFDKLGIQIPKKDEFYYDSTPVTFLPVGATIRFTKSEDVALLRSAYQMRPLFAVQMNDEIRMEMHYGGELCDYPDDVRVLDGLDNSGIETNDVLGHRRNCLYVPGTDRKESVCFDALYVRTSNPEVRQFQPDKTGIYDFSPLAHEKPDTQDIHYGHARALLRSLLTETGATHKQVWDELNRLNKKGLLISPWTEKRTIANGHNITAIAERYAESLTEPA